MKNIFYLVLTVLVLAGAYFAFTKINEFLESGNPASIAKSVGDSVVNSIENSINRSVITPVIPTGPVVEITPISEGGEQQMQAIVTALPTPVTRYRLGNATALRQYFQSYISKGSTSEILVPASLDTVGVGWYCENLKIAKTDWDLPWSTYGSIQSQYTTLYAGIPLNTIVNNMSIEGILHEQPIEQSQTETVYGNSAKVTIRVPIGLLTPGYRPGNSWKYTIQEPGAYYRAITDPLRELMFGDLVIARLRDKVDNRSRLAAELDAIAPLQDNWSRSSEYLDRLYELSVQSLNYPGTAEHPSSYDSIRQFAMWAVKDAGYQGLESLQVIVEKPTIWIYIEGGNPVIDPSLDLRLAESACPEFRPPQEWLDILNK
jgi:hypothetical protein